ncbi:hypothetical protein ACFLU5_18260 [Bacteroidota bacterium]
MKKLLESFMNSIQERSLDIYNEAALQYELAIYLREELKSKNYKIQLERNIKHFDLKRSDFVKQEMDIVIYKEQNSIKTEKHVIELKAIIDQNISRPISVYQWIKDLEFIEQLSKEDFTCYSIFISNNEGYKVECKPNDSPLLKAIRSREFSGGYKTHQKEPKKGSKVGEAELSKEYKFDWNEIKSCSRNLFYKVLES